MSNPRRAMLALLFKGWSSSSGITRNPVRDAESQVPLSKSPCSDLRSPAPIHVYQVCLSNSILFTAGKVPYCLLHLCNLSSLFCLLHAQNLKQDSIHSRCLRNADRALLPIWTLCCCSCLALFGCLPCISIYHTSAAKIS